MSTISTQSRTSPAHFFQDLHQWIAGTLERAFKLAFTLTKAGGLVRNLIFIWGALLLWAGLALVAHPFDSRLIQGFVSSVVQVLFSLTHSQPVKSLLDGIIGSGVYVIFLSGDLLAGMFAPDVLRHVLTYVIPFFVAFIIAYHYLADIFELDFVGIAARFMRQAAFAFNYHRLEIIDGQVAEKDRSSPLLVIGGPGIVNTHLENVAVFEKLDGQVHIIGQNPGGKRTFNMIDGFERLREVIDLRNQVTQANELSVEGRTRDGIRIIAQNVRLEFSVLRNPALSAQVNTANPFSYVEEAIHSLVYNRGAKYTWQAVMKGLIRRNLEEFIAAHKLNEILAASSFAESSTQDLALNFVPRQEVTESFLDEKFYAAASRLGLQLVWIDVGTWVAPTSTTQITQRHLDAWKLTCENQARRQNLSTLENETKAEEGLRLVREVPILARHDIPTQELSSKQKIGMIAAYLKLLRSAQAVHIEQKGNPSPELETAINFLNSHIKDDLERAGKAHWVESSPR